MDLGVGARLIWLHVPLARLALCLDCEMCFEIGTEPCPACGGRMWASLARFLEGSRGTTLRLGICPAGGSRPLPT
jgi:hypothetical protein